MHSKLQAALCLTHQPVAVYKTHQLSSDTFW